MPNVTTPITQDHSLDDAAIAAALEPYLAEDDDDPIPDDERRELPDDPEPEDSDVSDREALLRAVPTPVRMRVVGAWAGSAARRAPERWVGFARALRLNRLDLMINDYSKVRRCRPFQGATVEEITRIAELCHSAGIELHLTTWMLPCRGFIENAAAFLRPVMRDLNIASLVMDLEAPWNRTRDGLTRADAAALLHDRLPDTRIGVTAIANVNGENIRPLAECAQDLIPMAYATVNGRHDPADLVFLSRKKWLAQLGKAPNMMGLAGWHQGDDPLPRLRAAAAATAASGIDTVIYWSLFLLRRKAAIARFVASLRA